MKVIGLTGGIGAGKTTVAELLERHGAQIIDVDALGRDVIASGGSAVEAVVAHFGDAVRGPDGSVDRPALAGFVFGDPDALVALNSISHPAIDALLDEQLSSIAVKASVDTIVVLDMAVLTESTLGRNITHRYERVIVVEAGVETRLDRLVERGLTRDDASARMNSQASDADRRAIADFIITNDGTIDDLAAQVASVWSHL